MFTLSEAAHKKCCKQVTFRTTSGGPLVGGGAISSNLRLGQRGLTFSSQNLDQISSAKTDNHLMLRLQYRRSAHKTK